jgi:indole-3-glycerol phosphate synthase
MTEQEQSLRHGTVLEKIARATRQRIEREKSRVPIEELKDRIVHGGFPFNFADAFKGQGPRIIAEVKLRSPSSSELGKGLDPIDVALGYARNGACAISVLTEPEFFGGSVDYLSAIREKVTIPLLMKDFIVDKYQFAQAKAYGADAVLLITSLVGQELREMLQEASKWRLSALVEVHTEDQMETALKSGARIIGVNSRNLKTMDVDLEFARKLAPMAKDAGVILIAESGIRTREDIDSLSALGYRGFLIGTTFMKSGNPGRALADILGRKPA